MTEQELMRALDERAQLGEEVIRLQDMLIARNAELIAYRQALLDAGLPFPSTPSSVTRP